MKSFFIGALSVCFFFHPLKGQDSKSKQDLYKKKSAVSISFFKNGSVAGCDYEHMITKQVSFQIGAGYIGYGGGINFHLQPSVESSFFSLQYYNQGIGDKYIQSFVGPSYTYRSVELFTFSAGMGFNVKKGMNFSEYSYTLNGSTSEVLLTLAIGIFIPL